MTICQGEVTVGEATQCVNADDWPKRCSEGYHATPPGWFSGGCRLSTMAEKIFGILSEEVFFDGLPPLVGIQINDGSIANALNIASFPGLKRNFNDRHLHFVGWF